MSKHTEGPWQLIDASRGWVITANDGLYDIALVRDIGNEDNQANANVLVAAPDLLEACEALASIQYIEQAAAGPLKEALLKAIAAIKKARGTS